jgi:hypothetical protein
MNCVFRSFAAGIFTKYNKFGKVRNMRRTRKKIWGGGDIHAHIFYANFENMNGRRALGLVSCLWSVIPNFVLSNWDMGE